jgi:hypothetical protein
VLEHADRTGPLRDYCTGLILPGERKSVGTDGSEDGSGADGGAAPVVALSVSRPGRTRGAGRGARDGAAGN